MVSRKNRHKYNVKIIFQPIVCFDYNITQKCEFITQISAKEGTMLLVDYILVFCSSVAYKVCYCVRVLDAELLGVTQYLKLLLLKQ